MQNPQNLNPTSWLVRRRQWQPIPVLFPGKSHGQRSLVGCSPWGQEELDTTERLRCHFSLSCTGEGHGHPPQCSCLENPGDRGAWWAAVYGVEQNRTRLTRLSSSSSSSWLVQGGFNTLQLTGEGKAELGHVSCRQSPGRAGEQAQKMDSGLWKGSLTRNRKTQNKHLLP